MSGRGGVVRAVVPNGHAFQALDWIPYKDPNLKSAQNNGPVACWVFGNANPGKDTSGNPLPPIYGWTVFRNPTSVDANKNLLGADPAGSNSFPCPD
jgi:hypothetical protein